MEHRYKNGYSPSSDRRRTLPDLPPMTPPIPSPSLSARSAQSDPKSAWSKSPYNRFNTHHHYTSNPCLSSSGNITSTTSRAYPPSSYKLGSAKYRDQLSRSFDNTYASSSPLWRPSSPFRNPNLYERIRSRDHSLAKMYRNYVSNNDLRHRELARYQSHSQPGSPMRHSSGYTSRATSFREPFSSRSYRDLLGDSVSGRGHRFDYSSSSPGGSSGYASWREDPLLRHRFGDLMSSTTGGGSFSPTPLSPSRSQRIREIIAKSNANYYNLRESYNRLHQLGPSPPMSPLGGGGGSGYTRHRSNSYVPYSSTYSRSLGLASTSARDYFDDKDHGLGYPNDFASPTFERYLSGGDLTSAYGNEPSLLRRQFILDMMRLLFRSEYANLVYSPYSLATILAMVVPGTGGNTRAELIRALFDPLVDELCDAQTLVHKFATVNRVLTRRHSNCLLVTNFIYVDQRKNLNPTYMEIIRSDFSALAKSVNFPDRLTTSKTINTDVYRATRGLIPEVLRPFELADHTSVALVNTVYFKAYWAEHCSFFTNGRRFRTGTGRAVFTKFLIRKGRLLYTYDPELRTQLVQLDLANPHLALIILLPDDEYLPVSSFLTDYLSMSQLDRLVASLHQDYVDLVLPEFKLILNHSNLVHALKCLGIRDLFDESRADLHRMLGTYSRAGISKVYQKVVVEVTARGNPSGCVAPELSLLDLEMCSNPRRSPQYQEFHADRPFLWLLTTAEGIKREILLMGVVQDPSLRQ